jgi:site-specific recombinase XerD
MAGQIKLRGLAVRTQKQYLRFASAFLEWSDCDTEEPDEGEIQRYLSYLSDILELSDATIGVRSSAIRQLYELTDSRRILPGNGCLKADREMFSQYLLDLGYSKKSLGNYRWTIRCLDQFMAEKGLREYSRPVGEMFLDAAAKSGRHTPGIVEMMEYVVRRFNCFKEQGEYVLLQPRVSNECPPQFADGLAEYIECMRLRGLKESTIEQHRYNIQKVLLKFDAAGLHSFSAIDANAIYGAFEKTSDKHGFCSPMRRFLHHLFESGTIENDYSAFVPSVRRAHTVPSVYTKPETERLLGSIDADTDAGKRNSAVILLALRLGMRAGDIANLKITDIDFINKSVLFTQEKTRVPQRLELLPEIEESLRAYMLSARQVSDTPNVFLSLKSPVRAITTKSVQSLVRSQMRKSGIEIGERKQGPHSLRMTLASELVAEKIPYDAVRRILGHEDPVSIKHYVQFDIEALRSCAVRVPPPTGKLAEYMEARLGGGRP